MIVIRILELGLILLFVIVMVTQVMLPAAFNRQLWPLFRKRAKRGSKTAESDKAPPDIGVTGGQ